MYSSHGQVGRTRVNKVWESLKTKKNDHFKQDLHTWVEGDDP